MNRVLNTFAAASLALPTFATASEPLPEGVQKTIEQRAASCKYYAGADFPKKQIPLLHDLVKGMYEARYKILQEVPDIEYNASYCEQMSNTLKYAFRDTHTPGNCVSISLASKDADTTAELCADKNAQLFVNLVEPTEQRHTRMIDKEIKQISSMCSSHADQSMPKELMPLLQDLVARIYKSEYDLTGKAPTGKYANVFCTMTSGALTKIDQYASQAGACESRNFGGDITTPYKICRDDQGQLVIDHVGPSFK